MMSELLNNINKVIDRWNNQENWGGSAMAEFGVDAVTALTLAAESLAANEGEVERLRNTWIHTNHPCYGVDVFYDPDFEQAQGYQRLTDFVKEAEGE